MKNTNYLALEKQTNLPTIDACRVTLFGAMGN
jgi:hypothetical protein